MSDRARPKRIVAVDWDVRTLRVVHAVMGKRGVKIDRLLSVAIPSDVDPANPEQMGLHIRRTLDQEDVTTKHGVVDVPRDQAILKTLKLPAAQPEDLPGMVAIQIAKELPFPVSEAVIDFVATPHPDDPTTLDVLVAAARREQLEQYEAAFLAAGLKLDRIGLRPYANKVAVCELLRHGMPERVLFIDVRPTFMEIDVLRNSVLSFSRSASVVVPKDFEETAVFSMSGREAAGSTEIPPTTDEMRETPRRGQVIDSLVLEVRRSIEAYRAGDPGAMIDHVVIGGDVGVEEALADAVQKPLNVTTEIYNPASTFGWDPDEGAGASAFAAPLGLVLSHAQDGAPHFDFAHPKKAVSATQERLKKAPIVVATAVLFIAAGAVTFAEATKPSRRRLADLEARIAKMEESRGDNLKFLDLVEQVRDFDAGQHVWVDVLHDVFSLLPSREEMLLNHVEMNQNDDKLTLKTRAKDRGAATEVIHALEEYRRDGRDKPRFKVSMGPQTEKKRDEYPFVQDLRIQILDDEPTGGAGSRDSSRD